MTNPHMPTLGVVIVTYNSADVIRDCLESLLAASGVALRIVVVDNGSPDDTLDVLRAWADGSTPYKAPGDMPFALTPAPKPVSLEGAGDIHSITLIATGANTGFAGGVNRGLAHLARDAAIDRFWVLNPDCVVPAATPAVFATAGHGFSLLGGRVIYYDDPDQIQIDGGTVRWATGVTDGLNQYVAPAKAQTPDPAQFDFITGASMVASRAFYETAGPMREDYFLYYEEVDWAQRRGDLPLAYTGDGVVYHKAGTAIGSPTLGRGASAFSTYFKHRARLMFLWRFFKPGLIGGFAYSAAKALQLRLRGQSAAAGAIVHASLGLQPADEIRKRL